MADAQAQGLFGNVSALPENSDIFAKTTALANDYFDKGKTVEWVLDNVCGPRVTQRRLVLSLAQSRRIITSAQRKELGKKYLGEKDNDKFNKR